MMSDRSRDCQKRLKQSISSESCDELVLHISPALKRAYLRCAWILRVEDGLAPEEVASAMVRDFLSRHGC